MRFSKIVVAGLSAQLHCCVEGFTTSTDDAAVEEINEASLRGQQQMLYPGERTNHPLSTGTPPSTQAPELRNRENHDTHNTDDDDFAVDVGVLSTERKRCPSHPVVNKTGELTPSGFRELVYCCYSEVESFDDCPIEYTVGLHCWNTSLMTDLSTAFNGMFYFNDDVSSWDIGKVTTLHKTFESATHFNSDISSWDIGKVTSLHKTFQWASNFNSDISSWDIGNVTTLSLTFHGAYRFNVDISAWDTRNVTTMEGTFRRASSFNVDISSWDTKKVESMSDMFANATKFNQCLGSWGATSPSTVNTSNMLDGTGCPNRPWCQVRRNGFSTFLKNRNVKKLAFLSPRVTTHDNENK